jgi:hypothetical protein
MHDDGIYNNNSINFYANTNLNVKENSLDTQFTVYPNPTNSNLILNISIAITIDKFRVIDQTGKTVLKESNATQINVGKLRSGLYIIEFYSGSQKIQTKFIKEYTNL